MESWNESENLKSRFYLARRWRAASVKRDVIVSVNKIILECENKLRDEINRMAKFSW